MSFLENYGKSVLFLAFVMILMISCQNNQREADSSAEENIDSVLTEEKLEVNSTPIWEYDPELDSLIHVSPKHDFTLEEVIDNLNLRYKDIAKIDFVKRSNDTVYLKIEDALQMTSSIGSTGSFAYMAETVYALTEVKDVKYVNLDFEEGDHARPGTFDRSSF